MSDKPAPTLDVAAERIDDAVQINQNIPSKYVIATGASIAIGVGVMAVLGRFAFIYSPKISIQAYLLLFLLVTPFLLTYSERVEAVMEKGGLYGLVRRRLGIVFPYLAGWLELAGYAAVIAILARLIAIYGLTLYDLLIGNASFKPTWLALGAVLIVALFQLADLHGSRKLNTTMVYLGILFLAAISIISITHLPDQLKHLSDTLQTIPPFKVAALLTSSFWGVVLIFDRRHRIIRDTKHPVSRVSWSVMMIVIVLGVLLSVGTIPGGAKDQAIKTLTISNLSAIVYSGEPIYTVLIGFFSLWMAFIGLARAFRASGLLMSQMTEDGYFPPAFNYQVRHAIFPPLLTVALLSLVLIFFVDSMTVVGMAAAFLLAVTLFIHFPDLLQSRPRLPRQRPIRLPYHPLFPALTVIIATLSLTTLPMDALKWSGMWLLAGGALLALYGYKRALNIRAQANIIAEEHQPQLAASAEKVNVASEPVVLALIRYPESLPGMLRLGGSMAQQMKGALVIMQIAAIDEDVPEEEQQQQGRALWKQLSERIRHLPHPQGTPVRPMVRLAENVITGAINAAEEIQPHYLLIAPDFIAEDFDQNLRDYEKILQKTFSHTIFLNQLPEKEAFDHMALFLDQGVQAPTTLGLARLLLAEGGVLEIVHVILPYETKKQEDEEKARVLAILKENGLSEKDVQLTFLRADSLEAAVNAVAARVEMTILGANHNFMTRMSTFSGINAHIFQNARAPLMLVAKQEKLRLASLSQLWVLLTSPLPKLTLEDREEAARNIISGADPSVDFFILILLSAGIATYGLLQNSGAVIIGAMLVAPLMSPIVATAMSMIRGEMKYLGLATQATAQGVLLAIAVGAALTFFSPIKAPTNEIMGRVSPNLLDLSIAFLSGAAGAYAMSRKSIASALPGVSIAVALVPPLAVVGYGFAVADLDIAFGALLLFLTNLIAIILAASLVFIALDFLTTEKQAWGKIVKGLRVTLVFALIVMAILGAVTYTTVVKQRRLEAINQVLNQTLYAKSFKPLDVKIEAKRHSYIIRGTLLSFDHPLSSEELTKLGEELEAAVGGPVILDITSIPAQGMETDFPTAVTAAQIEEDIRQAIQGLPVQEIALSITITPNRYQGALSVLSLQPNALSPEKVRELESSLSQKYGKPVELTVYVVPGQLIQPSTPTPSAATPGPTPSS